MQKIKRNKKCIRIFLMRVQIFVVKTQPWFITNTVGRGEHTTHALILLVYEYICCLGYIYNSIYKHKLLHIHLYSTCMYMYLYTMRIIYSYHTNDILLEIILMHLSFLNYVTTKIYFLVVSRKTPHKGFINRQLY